MLEATPGIRAVAIFEELCRRHPEIAPAVRRTLERRIAKCRALNGPNGDLIVPSQTFESGIVITDLAVLAHLQTTRFSAGALLFPRAPNALKFKNDNLFKGQLNQPFGCLEW